MPAYYTMNPADLPALLTAWQSGSRVLCPCREQDGTTRLESFAPDKGLCLEYANLAMPPVDVLNGYQDVLFRWEGNERTYVAEPGAESMAPTVIFGMRPCDVAALEYLDDFYLGEYRDINYSLRREAVTIVGMNCRTPGKSCFCAATGTGPFARSGFDLMLTLDGGLCWVECATDKGENLVGQFNEERLDARSGRRVRVKDSCQTAGFTRNAGWHNPRSKAAAVRHRIMDKLVYIQDRFGKKGCVGCGRCIDVCPAGIDIRKIAATVVRDCPPEGQRKPVPVSIPERASTRIDPQLFTPYPARIVAIHDETPDIRRYVVRYMDERLAETFRLTGQFFMVTVFGVGEVALSIPFGDQHDGQFEFCVKKVGKVTSALARLDVGDVIGLRGPYGKGFPYRSFAGRDVLVVGSGVGLAPVRTIIVRLLQERERYGRIAIIASATRYEGLVYKQDLKDWSRIPGVTVQYALARPTDAVQAHVGYINDLLPELDFDWANARAILCASPRRIKLVARDLLGLGMNGRDIFTSLETHMRCGVGKCGHCKVGAHYMCLDGPVFTYEEMLQLPEEF